MYLPVFSHLDSQIFSQFFSFFSSFLGIFLHTSNFKNGCPNRLGLEAEGMSLPVWNMVKAASIPKVALERIRIMVRTSEIISIEVQLFWNMEVHSRTSGYQGPIKRFGDSRVALIAKRHNGVSVKHLERPLYRLDWIVFACLQKYLSALFSLAGNWLWGQEYLSPHIQGQE